VMAVGTSKIALSYLISGTEISYDTLSRTY